MAERLRRLRREMGRLGCDALILTDLRDIRYVSGFTGSSAYVILAGSSGWFLTDSRYTGQAGSEVAGLKVVEFKKALESVSRIISKAKPGTIGFQGDSITYSTYLRLKKALPGAKLKNVPGIVQRLRAIKDAFEVERIKAAVKLLDAGYEKAARILSPGVVEEKAAFEIETGFRRMGAEGPAFETIIASGHRGALPHGKASEKKIKKGELVVVDMGVLRDGYNSDETRTYCIGRAGRQHREVYGIVKEAQERALSMVRPWVRAADVDRAARDVIKKAGYARYFGHGTGHGVGLAIHEAPSLGPLSEDVLEEGMVITVEPGIYLPGWGGVRIEDMALVVKGGFEVLTKTPKDLVCL